MVWSQAVATRAAALAAHAARLHDAARALDLAAAAARALRPPAGAAAGAGEQWAAAAALAAGEAEALRGAAAALRVRHAGASGAGAGGALRAAWLDALAAAPCPAELRLARRARALAERLRESWQHLVRDRATRALTYNDEQFHVLERITVAETGRRARALLQRAAPMARARADAIADWYKVAQTVYLQTQILDKDLSATELKVLALAARLQDAEHATRALVADAQAQSNTQKQETPIEKEKETRSRGAGAGARAGSAGAGAGGVGAAGAGVRALLAAHEDVAAAVAASSALVARLVRLTADAAP
ncbi:unnamed protein product, partial [Brenthis ino]